MADELDLKDDLSDEGEAEMDKAYEARVAELERLMAQKDEELTGVKARLAGLEQTIADKDSEMAVLAQSRDELEEKLAVLNNSLVGAVSSYKEMVVQANPDVVAELINGDTIESVNESLTQAKALVSKVRQGVEAEISLARVPVGAPERTSLDLSILSPREKIKYAIGGRR